MSWKLHVHLQSEYVNTEALHTKFQINMVDFENLERSSAKALHAIEHSHSINFEQPEILAKNWHIYRERIAAEQLYINNDKTAGNTKKKSLHPAWNLIEHLSL